jgi:hypothetical protein
VACIACVVLFSSVVSFAKASFAFCGVLSEPQAVAPGSSVASASRKTIVCDVSAGGAASESFDDDSAHVASESSQAVWLVTLDDAERAVEALEHLTGLDVGAGIEHRDADATDGSSVRHQSLLRARDRIAPPSHESGLHIAQTAIGLKADRRMLVRCAQSGNAVCRRCRHSERRPQAGGEESHSSRPGGLSLYREDGDSSPPALRASARNDNPTGRYCARIATIGSTFVARRAGTRLAASVTTTSTPTTAAKVSGSVGSIP